MHSIPTTYRGTTFRSRMEADFAATFDGLRVQWDYEPEGFQLASGERYLPDFYLPQSKAWVEVKGPHLERVTKVEEFAAELFTISGVDNWLAPDAPMVALATTDHHSNYPYYPTQLIPRFIGVNGPGVRRSIGFAWCVACNAIVIINLGHDQVCRNCQSSMDWGRWVDTWGQIERNWLVNGMGRAPKWAAGR